MKETSEGARYERKAVRAYLRRAIERQAACGQCVRALQDAINWILTRQKRYDKKKGGL